MHHTLSTLVSLCCMAAGGGLESLPVGSAPEPVAAPHFPSRLHTFVWRNWECCNLNRIADAVSATEEQIGEIGASMGLPPHEPVSNDHLERNYISIIRRNWHLLPYDQLLTLLGWDADKLAHTLREDDFLIHKLGDLKPACKPLKYAEPDEAARTRSAEIRNLVNEVVGPELTRPAEPRFAFVDELSRPLPGNPPEAPAAAEPIRFAYSYFAVYGDPLINDGLDPYPDGLLQRLSAVGANGVWLHVVLRQLAPSRSFPEFGEGWEKRLANLRKLVDRAARHGIKVYLYMNEPRSMPEPFFANREDMRGVSEGRYRAMCTSNGEVRHWMADSLRHVFANVPGLGGVFTISASENLTNCWAHYHGDQCPRCGQRTPVDVIAEVNNLIATGVREGSGGKAATIVWDWGWKNEWCEELIGELPKDVHLMSVSEWDLPIERGGVESLVGEYALSAVGPGPRALRNWAFARAAGLKTMAKIQANCTWELSAVPWLPVMDLVAEHSSRLAERGVEGRMLSWTLGGYPSPNLELMNMFNRQPPPTSRAALTEVAICRYGAAAAPHVRRAWTAFSRGFSEFPYHIGVLYSGPMQMAPSNLLYPESTGYAATMVGFPYDHLDRWRAIYPPEVFYGQMVKVAESWREGLDIFRERVLATSTNRQVAEDDLRLASAAYLHIRSAANQTRFIIDRESGDKDRWAATRKRIASAELEVARRMFSLVRQDSRIGYEASNHYFYYPFDLVEKIINCDYVMRMSEPAEDTDAGN